MIGVLLFVFAAKVNTALMRTDCPTVLRKLAGIVYDASVCVVAAAVAVTGA
jgi:hypothetical protein